MSSRLSQLAAGSLLSLVLVACQSTTSSSTLTFDGNAGEVYSFTARGLQEGELITPDQIALSLGNDDPISLLITVENGQEGEANIDVTFNGNEPRGTWNIQVSGSEGFAGETSFEYAPQSPMLSLATVEENSDGSSNYVFVGSGWEPGESLSFTTQGPNSPSQELPVGTASEIGYSVAIPVPFVANPSDGIYTFSMYGEHGGSASHQVICLSGICQ